MNLKNIKDMLKCFHRHTIEDHPGCFASGAVKDTKLNLPLPWYKQDGMRIGYLDIETSNLDANFGDILTWCIKEKGSDSVVSCVIEKEDLFSGKFDKDVVSMLVDELRKYRIIVGYYSSRFDIPFIRTKALKYGIEFPGYGELYSFDLYYTVRNKLKLHRNSLDAATTYLGIAGKTHIDWEVWNRAKYGDIKSLEEVLDHNVNDVIITEKLHDKLTPFAKWNRTSI